MQINTMKRFLRVLMDFKRNEGNGRPSLPDIAITYAWNDVPDEVIMELLEYYNYETPDEGISINQWKNQILFNEPSR